MSELSHMLDMGNHGVYVWSAYGVGLAIIVANIVLPLKKQAQLTRRIKRMIRREEG